MHTITNNCQNAHVLNLGPRKPNQSHRSCSHDVVIRVYDVAGNVIETRQRAGDFPDF